MQSVEIATNAIQFIEKSGNCSFIVWGKHSEKFGELFGL